MVIQDESWEFRMEEGSQKEAETQGIGNAEEENVGRFEFLA